MFFKQTRKTRGRIENKNKTRDKIPEDRMCAECEYSEYIKGMSIKDCVYICNKDPKHPVKMGNFSNAQHRYRNKNKEEQKRRGR